MNPQKTMRGGLWGTYRRAVRGGKITVIRARARWRDGERSRRCPQACDRVASKRFTDLARFVPNWGRFCATVAIARRPTRPNFVANWQHFLWGAADHTTTKRPDFVSYWTQIRAMVDAYSAARWSLRCFVMSVEMQPTWNFLSTLVDVFREMVAADGTTTKRQRDPRANGNQPGPPPPFGGTPIGIPPD